MDLESVKSPMRKVRFEAIGSSILFILMGLVWTVSLKNGSPDQLFSPPGVAIILVLFVYLIVFQIIQTIWNRKLGLPFRYSFTRYDVRLEDDEREAMISGIAHKYAFGRMRWAIICSLGFFNVVYVNQNRGLLSSFDMYTFGCWLFVICLIVGSLSFSHKWCDEYEKLYT